MAKKNKKLKKVKKSIFSVLSLPNKLINFLKSVIRELKEVEWLSKRETFNWSVAVISTAIMISFLIIVVDIIFFKLRELIFNI